MRQGPASITVTGTALPSSSKNWDIPNFFPRMPMDIGEGKDASWTTPQQHKANWGRMTEAKRVFRSGLAGTDHRWSCGL